MYEKADFQKNIVICDRITIGIHFEPVSRRA